MSPNERISFLYELGRSQTDHEQQNSAELSTRAGLLAALAGLIAIGLTEIWRFSGTSLWIAFTCVVLASGIVLLLLASIGEYYERAGSAMEWTRWISAEEKNGRSAQEIDDQLLQTLCNDYAICAEKGMCANDKKSKMLNGASVLIVVALFCLLVQIFWASFSPNERYKSTFSTAKTATNSSTLPKAN